MFVFKKLCRLCASDKDVLLTLNNWDSDNIQILNKLNEIAPTIILESCDELPKGICTICIKELNDAYIFIKNCMKAQEILKQYLREIQNKKVLEENAHNIETKKIKIEEQSRIVQENRNEVDSSETKPTNYNSEINFVSVSVKCEPKDYIDEENFDKYHDSSISSSENDTIIKVEEFNQVREEKLKTEIEKSINGKPYKCRSCDKAYMRRSTLRDHVRTHTNERPYSCDICEKTFMKNNDLKMHFRVHTNERPYKCNICGKAFAQNGNLITHSRTHSQEKLFKCEICDRGFTQLENLKTHNRIHSNEKPYNCAYCDKAFARTQDLKIHTRTHTNERPYKCEVCERAFTQYGSLKTHGLTHLNDRPSKIISVDSITSANSGVHTEILFGMVPAEHKMTSVE